MQFTRITDGELGKALKDWVNQRLSFLPLRQIAMGVEVERMLKHTA
jgi:hypothetical protein